MPRSFDILFSAAALVLLSPLMLVIAIFIKLDSVGQVFFSQQRMGFNNQPFWIYKFRTMQQRHKPKDALDYIKPGDSRITRMGRLLRNTSLDELPQFFNVLKGEMSVVGPRPLPLAQTEYLSQQFPNFPKRHSVKPGITGLVQVSDMRSCVDSLAEHKARLDMDLWYIKNRNFLFNSKIILKTVWTMIARYNISAKLYSK